MTKKELEKLEMRYRAKAERAYMRYQETGIQRYANEQQNAEDIADASLMAINAAEEHTELIHMRGNMARFGENARKALNSSDADKEMSLREIVSYCELCGLLRKEG